MGKNISELFFFNFGILSKDNVKSTALFFILVLVKFHRAFSDYTLCYKSFANIIKYSKRNNIHMWYTLSNQLV